VTDRELLELAAKATGINIKMDRIDADDKFIGFIVGARNTGKKSAWNPLTDDGDALRLAVKLGLFMRQAVKEIPRSEYEKDPYAATRRAIVRAAAAIGAAP